ncbi:MAG: TPM domain-containing protein [Alphaproteobacteria bacterium]
MALELLRAGRRRGGAVRWVFAAVLSICACAAWAAPRYPALEGRVVDGAGMIPSATRAQLSQLLEAHERKTSNQVVVVTIASLDGQDIAEYGVGLGRAWKLGQGERNNGAIVLIAAKERLVRIEVGYGLEGALTDARARLIIEREMVPRFRAGDMADGIVAGTMAVLASVEGTYEAKPGADNTPGGADWMALLPLVVFVVFGVLGQMNRRRGLGVNPWLLDGPWGARPGGRIGGLGGGIGRGLGGRSGGFTGGGGSFGGGGATGRW